MSKIGSSFGASVIRKAGAIYWRIGRTAVMLKVIRVASVPFEIRCVCALLKNNRHR